MFEKSNTPSTGELNPTWKNLYKTGAFAALLSLAFFPIQIAVFLISPPPEAVLDWFNLIHDRPFIGLIDLDLLLVVDQVLVMLIFVAVYIALRNTCRALSLIGLILGLASTILFITSNPALAMLSLSGQYFAAGDESVRALTLAAGQSIMANWQGTSFHASYIVGSIASVLLSLAMLRSRAFTRAAGIMGMVANLVAFGLYVPVIGVYISVFSVLFLWAWYLLTAIGLFRMVKTSTQKA